MTYRGHVRGGVVVIDAPTSPPEGATVEVRLTTDSTDVSQRGETLADLLGDLAGRAVDLPPDASENHDHYLYGVPKR
jgi:hypothetical protein